MKKSKKQSANDWSFSWSFDREGEHTGALWLFFSDSPSDIDSISPPQK